VSCLLPAVSHLYHHPSCLYISPGRFIVSCYVFCYVFSVTCSLKCFVLVTCTSVFIKYLVPGFNHCHLPGCPAFGSSPHHNRNNLLSSVHEQFKIVSSPKLEKMSVTHPQAPHADPLKPTTTNRRPPKLPSVSQQLLNQNGTCQSVFTAPRQTHRGGGLGCTIPRRGEG